MIVSISLGLLLVGIVIASIAAGRQGILSALAAVLLGFYADKTVIAPPLNSALSTCLDFINQIASWIGTWIT